IADGAGAPVEVAEGSVFSTPTGSVLETASTCSALPGRVSAVAVLADGWLVLDPLKPPYGLQPFGVRPRVGAELWLGIDTTVNPLGTLCLAVDLLAPPGRASAESSATVDPAASPMLRWEAMATHGPAELALDFDGTRGLQRGGVVGFRVPDLDWAPRLRPGQATGTSYR